MNQFLIFRNKLPAYSWQQPAILLMAMAVVMQLAFAAWMTANYNFAVEVLSFSGREIGIQQSIREIPGFMAFAAVFLLFVAKEQTIAYVSLLLLGGAVAVTGYFGTFTGFLITTFISSVGFHYYETMNQSLTLQWLPKATAPATMGRIIAVGSIAALVSFGLVFIGWEWLGLEFKGIFMLTGGLSIFGTLALWLLFPHFPSKVTQNRKLILRKRYWLYYLLTFFSGARRQVFIVFAAFLMVERFGLHVHEMAGLFIINGILNFFLAPKIGKWIIRFGERKALTIEYIGLIIVFLSYAFVSNVWIAVALYVIDHAFFAMAIAMKTYFQKIADPADMAPTAGVAFTINHIAAVVIPVVFGLVWLWSPAAVFISGAGMALGSLLLASLIPDAPEDGNEIRREAVIGKLLPS